MVDDTIDLVHPLPFNREVLYQVLSRRLGSHKNVKNRREQGRVVFFSFHTSECCWIFMFIQRGHSCGYSYESIVIFVVVVVENFYSCTRACKTSQESSPFLIHPTSGITAERGLGGHPS